MASSCPTPVPAPASSGKLGSPHPWSRSALDQPLATASLTQGSRAQSAAEVGGLPPHMPPCHCLACVSTAWTQGRSPDAQPWPVGAVVSEPVRGTEHLLAGSLHHKRPLLWAALCIQETPPLTWFRHRPGLTLEQLAGVRWLPDPCHVGGSNFEFIERAFSQALHLFRGYVYINTEPTDTEDKLTVIKGEREE